MADPRVTDAPLLPGDEWDRRLVAHVRPGDWVNPQPPGRYHLVVLGAGTAGLVTAAVAAGLGARVALVEKHLMGGDCLNAGCVPSKALLRAARAWDAARRGGEFGVSYPGGVATDFSAAAARMRRLRAGLAPNDSAARFRSLGVDVYLGEGRFTGPDTLAVDGRSLRFARAAVCTGARAAVPPVPGLREAGYLTSETVFALTAPPPRLAVLGGGPIGCELAQAFARFGSRVTLLERGERLLPRDEPDAAEVVRSRLARGGVHVWTGAEVTRVERRGAERVLHLPPGPGGGPVSVAADAVLVAAGRAPNVEGIGLEAAGVAFDAARGVTVDDHLRTTNPRVFAAGDVASAWKFTHAADALAKVLVQNALVPHPLGLGYARASRLVVPWCTYTEPEVAQVGLTRAEAEARGVAVDAFTVPLDEVDRAVLDGDAEGFARVLVRRGTDRVAGATVVAPRAGDLIALFALLTTAGVGLGSVASTIFPYPTHAEAAKKLANAWRRAGFTPRKRKAVRALLRLVR